MGIAAAAALFAAAFFYTVLILILRAVFAKRMAVRSRLAKLGNAGPEEEKPKKKKRRSGGTPAAASLTKGISQRLRKTGIPLRAEEFLLAWLAAAALLPLIVGLFSGSLLAACGVAVFGVMIPPMIVRRFEKKRAALFERQLSDMLTVVSNCLRSGFTFQQAMDNVVRDMPDPISSEFGAALREMRLGVPLETALQNMVEREGNDDLGLLVSAVVIQRQVGGSLSEILDGIAATIGERLRIRGEIRVLTSSGRISGLIVGLLPVFMLAILMIINPSYVGMFFTTPVGNGLLVLAAAMEAVGFTVISKIVNIKF